MIEKTNCGVYVIENILNPGERTMNDFEKSILLCTLLFAFGATATLMIYVIV